MLFSQRMGYKPVRDKIQKESLDQPTRNQLWNKYSDLLKNISNTDAVIELIWTGLYKQTKDTLPRNPYNYSPKQDWLRDYFIEKDWYESLDIIEFTVKILPSYTLDKFINYFNFILERECSAYRLINGKFTQITSKEEIQSIEDAINIKVNPVRTHLNQAFDLFADRKNPDYRNSIKESISAVECLVKKITGKSKFQAAVNELFNQKIIEHAAMKEALGNLYGYASDEDGIRHPIMDRDTIKSEDAKYMLVICTAFINYMMAKCKQSEIKL
ncbi:MAG: hypothetical protein PHC34_05295 [Candidatus Gastranaerophilales bacterium]|nr:hypothetical protein [Candidatus Gastranaerophilales bacterium]